MHGPEDDPLVPGLVAGREDAFAALYDRYGPLLFRVAVTLLGSRADAEDAVQEVFVGLNDLHLSLGQRFMFEPLADGSVDRVAQAARRRGLRFGFGGIARMGEGLLPGREVLAEHVRLGSGAVILARAFRRGISEAGFEEAVRQLRLEEARLAGRTPAEARADAARIAARIRGIAAELAAAG